MAWRFDFFLYRRPSCCWVREGALVTDRTDEWLQRSRQGIVAENRSVSEMDFDGIGSLELREAAGDEFWIWAKFWDLIREAVGPEHIPNVMLVDPAQKLCLGCRICAQAHSQTGPKSPCC